MYDTDLDKDLLAVEQQEDSRAILAELECWLIDDFVDMLPRDRRTHLNADLG